jgi:hypothetical protein
MATCVSPYCPLQGSLISGWPVLQKPAGFALIFVKTHEDDYSRSYGFHGAQKWTPHPKTGRRHRIWHGEQKLTQSALNQLSSILLIFMTLGWVSIC